MNSKVVLIGGATVAIAAAAVAVPQFGYQDQVKYQVDALVANIDQATLFGEGLEARLLTHSGSLMQSEGVIEVYPENDVDTKLRIEYSVNHGPATLLAGAAYQANIINSMIKGQGERTLTTEFLGGQPITIKGSAKADSVDGLLSIPAINFAQRRDALTAEPVSMQFNIDGLSGQNLNAANGALTVPSIRAKDGGEEFSMKRGTLTFSNSFGKSTNGDFALKIAELTVDERRAGRVLELTDITVSTRTDIATTLSNSFSVSARTLELPEQALALSDIGFGYTVNGIDGMAFNEAVEIYKKVAAEGWSDRKMKKEMGEMLQARADYLISHSPSFEITQLKFSQNGKVVIDAKGKAQLDSSKLPNDYLSKAINSGRGPDPQLLMAAGTVKVNAVLGDAASNLAALVNPQAAAIIRDANGQFSLTLKDGAATMNGNPL